METQDRVYEGGRCTEGWFRGNKISQIDEAVVGMYVICVHHQNETESLFKVTTASNHQFEVQPCDQNAVVLTHENTLSVWKHDLKRVDLQEWYIADRKTPLPKYKPSKAAEKPQKEKLQKENPPKKPVSKKETKKEEKPTKKSKKKAKVNS